MEKMNRDTRMDVVEGVTSLVGDSTMLGRLTESDYGPFLLLFCLFIVGFVMCVGGMILLVIGGRISLVLFVLLQIVGIVIVVRKKWALKNQRGSSRGNIWNETEKWVIIFGWCLPRKYREAIMGDIIEDCHEMRERGLAERRILTHVLWQWSISIVTLILTFVMRAISFTRNTN